MKQRLSTSRKAKILRGRKPAVSSAKIVSNATNLVHIRGNKVLERILDDGYSGMMVSQKSKADKAAEFLSEVTVEEWDHLLRALTSKWETAFANRQMQARREGNSTPPPAPPHVDVDFETTEPRKRQVAGGALTVEKLIDRYLTDADSPFHALRHSTKSNYHILTRRLRDSCGGESLANLRFADLYRLYEGWTSAGVPIGNAIMTTLRLLLTYGAGVLRDEDCERLVGALKNFKFKTAARRDSNPLTADQAAAIRAKAKESDWRMPSVALAQAFQFDCGFSQKDILGEWIPELENGESDIVADGKKWLAGIRWEEINDKLVLSHLASHQQKIVEVDLKTTAMVVEELDAAYPGFLSDRSLLPATGPIIVCEKNGRPWTAEAYRRLWRLIANEVGIPISVKKTGPRDRSTDEGDKIKRTAETEVPAVRH